MDIDVSYLFFAIQHICHCSLLLAPELNRIFEFGHRGQLIRIIFHLCTDFYNRLFCRLGDVLLYRDSMVVFDHSHTEIFWLLESEEIHNIIDYSVLLVAIFKDITYLTRLSLLI